MKSRGGVFALPVTRRTRGFRLYDLQGRRLIDLHREGALLGHRGAPTTAMKSALSQGLDSGLPSVWEGRLIRALGRRFPAHPTVALYVSMDRALAAATLALGRRITARDLYDPALDPTPERDPLAALWRPFLPMPSARILVPVMPLSVCGVPAPLCLDDPEAELPPSDPISGFILAGAHSAFLSLWPDDGSAPLRDPALERVLDRLPAWELRGPYVKSLSSPDEYPGIVRRFLEAGVLLCPRYPGPSVLPAGCSPGERNLLARLFASCPGG